MLSPMYYTVEEGGEFLELPEALKCLTTEEWVRVMTELTPVDNKVTVAGISFHCLIFSNPFKWPYVRWDCYNKELHITSALKGE